MSTSNLPDTDAVRAAVTALFQNKAPILVEVRFPKMGTSPDWYLCEDEDDLSPILERLASGVEVHMQSVWDLKGTAEPVIVRK